MRICKTEYYLGIAKAVSMRSTCLRRQYGAVIVKDDEIIATGYNGSPRGSTNCCDVGYCERETRNIEHGQRYELCKSVHAEQNAIISADRAKMIGSILYLYGREGEREIKAEPCTICARMIQNAGISAVVTSKGE